MVHINREIYYFCNLLKYLTQKKPFLICVFSLVIKKTKTPLIDPAFGKLTFFSDTGSNDTLIVIFHTNLLAFSSAGSKWKGGGCSMPLISNLRTFNDKTNGFEVIYDLCVSPLGPEVCRPRILKMYSCLNIYSNASHVPYFTQKMN